MADVDTWTPGNLPADAKGGEKPPTTVDTWTPGNLGQELTPGEYAARSHAAGVAVGRPLEEQQQILKAKGFGQEAVKRLGQSYELDLARQKQKEQGFGAADTGGEFLRSGLGLADLFDAKGTSKYQAALKRYKDGSPNPGDAERIARYEYLQQVAKEGTIFGSRDAAEIAHGILSVPKMAQEAVVGSAALRGLGAVAPGSLGRGLAAAGGATGEEAALISRANLGRTAALLPTMPSMYWEEAKEKNIAQGRDPSDWRGLSAAGLHGYANLLVLNKFQQGITRKGFGGAMAKAGAGVLEQGAVDSATNFADKFLTPDTWKISTGYGTFENLMAGKEGEALKQGVGQFLTFAAFTGLHKASDRIAGELDVGAAHDALKSAKEDIDKLKATGLPPDMAGAALAEFGKRVADVINANQPDAAEVLAKMKVPGTEQPSSLTERIADVMRRAKKFEESQPATLRVEAEQLPADPRARSDRLTELRNKSDERVAAAERSERSARQRAQVLNAPGDAQDAFAKAETELRRARRERIDIQKNLDAVRDELMRQPNRPPEQPPDVPQPPEGPPRPRSVQTGNITATGGIAAPVKPGEAAERYYRVPDSKGAADNVDAAVRELVGNQFAGKWFSRNFEGNAGYKGHVQIEFRNDRLGGEGDVVNRGERDVQIGAQAPMYIHPALSAIKYRGPAEGPQFERLRGLVEQANQERAARGLEPIELHVGEAARRGHEPATLRVEPKPETTKEVNDAAARIPSDTGRAGVHGGEPAGVARPVVEDVQAKVRDGFVQGIEAGTQGRAPQERTPAAPPGVRQDTEGAPAETPARPQSAFDAQAAQHLWDTMTKEERRAEPPEVVEAYREAGADVDVNRPVVTESETDRVLDPEHERLIDESGLSDARKEGVKALMAGESVRDAERAASSEVTYETLRKDAVKLFGETAANAVAREAQQRVLEMRYRQQEQMGGGRALHRIPPRQRPTATEASATAMIAGKIAENAAATSPGTPGSPGAMRPLDPATAEHAAESGRRWWQTFSDWWGKLAGQVSPATNRLSEKSADQIARVGSAGHFAREMTPNMLDRILTDPEHASAYHRDAVGGVMVEDSLRHAREYHLGNAAAEERALAVIREQIKAARRIGAKDRLADLIAERDKRMASAEASRKAAAKVGTIIRSGRTPEEFEANPFKSEADYQALRNEPWVQEAIQRYQKEYVPLKEDYFRKSQGLADEDAISGPTQIPGRPIYRLALPEGAERFNSPGGSARGSLTAHRARKLGQSKEFQGTGHYEIDLGRIIEADLQSLVPNAAKASLYRTLVSEGIGKWSTPQEGGPEGWEKLPEVRPPKGTQEATAGQTDLWVHPDTFKDIKQALGVGNDPPSRLPFAAVLAKAVLASTIEFTYHVRNLFTLLTRPGMNPIGFIRNVRRLMTGDKDLMKRVAELAEMGAMKEHGFESEHLLPGGKYNPINWVTDFLGKTMTVVDRAMRLTADHAFDVISKREGVDASEGARRDFINQLGNYNKATQSRMVAWLRDTGIGPFATAGTNFYVQGLRSLAGSHGYRTTSREADLKLRAEMIFRTALLPALAAGLNMVLWGRWDGDDKTPLTGIKVGTGKDGKTSYLDLGGLIGVTRGMRETGLLALAEQQRAGALAKGATKGDAFDHAVDDMAHAVIHPAVGPLPAALYTGFTGKNTLGAQVAPKADVKLGESQKMLNAYAGLFQVNPVLESWVEPLVNKEVGLKAPRKEVPAEERAMKMLGPFGVKFRGQAPGAPHREMTVPVRPMGK